MLAPPVQTSKNTFDLLHHRCKQKKLLLGRCTGGASISKNVLTIAWLPQDLSAGALFLHRTHVRVNAFSKCQNETRDRSRTSRNAFPPHETDQNFLETPKCGGKPIKISEKSLFATGNGGNSSKSHFPRRERGKMPRKMASCGGKASKSFGDRFRVTGKGWIISKNAFPPRNDSMESP